MNQAIIMTAFSFGVNATAAIAFPNPVCQTDGYLSKQCAGLTATESASIYHEGKIAAVKGFYCISKRESIEG